MTSPFEDYLAELCDLGQPIVTSKLANLSDLTPEEAEAFCTEWPGIDVARRRQILERLAELAEDNLDLDFDGVFLSCLADQDGGVRARAIEGLWQCTESCLIDHLVSMIEGDTEDPVREAAAAALGKFALLAELGKLEAGKAQKVEEVLLATFNNTNEQLNVRCRALEAISPLSEPPVEDMIRSAYYGDRREMQASALYAMGHNCNPAWLPLLLKELHSPYPRLRFEAVRACAELEAEEAVPRLIELIGDSDPQVQISAVEALGEIGGGEAKAALRQCLDSPEEPICEAAREALAEIGFWEDPFTP